MHQHDRVEGLVTDLSQAGERSPEARQELLRELGRELRSHLELEERYFYPLIAPRLILASADTFLEEHRRLRELFETLETEGPGPELPKRIQAVRDMVLRHLGDEEVELFQEVKRRFSVDELDELGERLEHTPQAEAFSGAPLSPET
jgi:hemerythrin superfamily protein